MSKFILSGFADEIAADLATQLHWLNNFNIKYVEMRNVNGKGLVNHTLDEVRSIKEELDKSGIKVSAVGSPIGKIGITDDFEPHYDLFKHTMDIADILETKYIRMFSFFIPEMENAEKYREEVINRWTRMCEYAKDTGITLLHENEKGIYGDTPERCLDLLEALSGYPMKGIFDPANFVQCRVRTYPEAFDLLKDHIVYMHIKDAKMDSGWVVPSGEGDGNLREILNELSKSGYEGFLSLEPHLITGDIAVGGHERFKIALDALKSILDELDAEVL